MTGRELIMYILENNLENEEVFKNGRFIGFIDEKEAAKKFDVGTSTIRMWVKMDMLHGIQIGNAYYIPGNAKDPREALCSN